MKKNSLITLAILVIVLSVLLAGCTGNNEKNETTLPETENSTTQVLPVTEEKETTTEKPETTTEKKSIEEVAKEVINGEWGSGEERRKNLEKAGYDYDEVQAAVNKSVPKQGDTGNKGGSTSQPKPTQASTGRPAGSGGLDMSQAGKGPNTSHVGGESSDEAHQAAQDSADKNGWDLDWELN